MSILRKLILTTLTLGIAFGIAACSDQKKKCVVSIDHPVKEKYEKQHSRW